MDKEENMSKDKEENMSKDTNKQNVVESEPEKLVSNDFTSFTSWVEILVMKCRQAKPGFSMK